MTLPRVSPVVVCAFALACAPSGTPDGGGAPVCRGGGERGIDAGHTGLSFVPIVDGDELPAWARPQGGIGTRINVRLTGFDESVRRSGRLTTRFLGPSLDATCAAREDCDPLQECDDGVCRPLLAEEHRVNLPLECQEDGTLLVAEMPVRFGNQTPLSTLDGSAQELHLTLALADEEPVTTSVGVVMRVGAFVPPSWWEEGEP